jgi:predicted DCC family thiol-disulfide oxidoreductase YuxK
MKPYIALYDQQCEICQALSSWLRLLDRNGRVLMEPIVPERVREIHPVLEIQACLRSLHVVTPDNVVLSGWQAVATLARLFPTTWLIGVLANFPGVVIRRAPKDALREKLAFFEWLHAQIEQGLSEGLPARAVEATCFPWGRSSAWENFLNDEFSRLISGGEFSRSELVRSFIRGRDGSEILPIHYQVRLRG